MNNLAGLDFKTEMMYAGGAGAVAGVLGLLGGYTLSFIVPEVSLVGHALTLGLTFPLASMSKRLLSTAWKTGEIQKIVVSMLISYLSSHTVVNLLGFSVRILAPLVGLATLGIAVVAIIALVVNILAIGGVSVGALNIFRVRAP